MHLKTYSRQNKRALADDGELVAKRRRFKIFDDCEKTELDASNKPFLEISMVPTSPSPRDSHFQGYSVLSSNELKKAEFDLTSRTPPSSPAIPPILSETCHRPPFSLLIRRRTEAAFRGRRARSLSSLKDLNARASLPLHGKKKSLKQLQIDLGGETQKACKTCGMEYIPSNVEDALLHQKFHAMNEGGIDVGKALSKRVSADRILKEWAQDSEKGKSRAFVLVIDSKSPSAERNKANTVLKVVNTELSAIDADQPKLWSRRKSVEAAHDRYKVYLYIRANKCIGLCLAERISEGYKASTSTKSSAKLGSAEELIRQSSSISVSTEAFPAILGISRIWTSKLHRRQGIARTLLDCARTSFIYGVAITKDMVAFSQPTESGGNLARGWHEGAEGWLVYKEL